MSRANYWQKQVVNFFDEIYITLNKILSKNDNIILAADLNIDELMIF